MYGWRPHSVGVKMILDTNQSVLYRAPTLFIKSTTLWNKGFNPIH